MKIIRKILLCLAVLMSVSFAQSMVTQAAETQDNVQFIKENEEVSGELVNWYDLRKISFHLDKSMSIRVKLSLTTGIWTIAIKDANDNYVYTSITTLNGNTEYHDTNITANLNEGTYTLTLSSYENNPKYKVKYFQYGFENRDEGLMFHDEEGYVKGWHFISDIDSYKSGTYYFDENGYAVNGFQTLNNELYYFDNYVVDKSGWKNIDGDLYYFSKTSGSALNGWQTMNGDTYYFDNYKAVSDYHLIDGDLYYFDNQYRQKKYDHTWLADGHEIVYYFIDGKAVNGLQNIDGEIYYFKDFKRLRGLYSYNGDWYFFDNNLQKNRWYYSDTGSYYFGDDYKAVNGWKEIDGNLYYFKDFKMQEGLQFIDGDYYYFGLYAQKGMINGYIFGDDYKAIKEGFVEIEDSYYYVDNYSYQHVGFKTIDGDTYYFNEYTFAAVNGWLYLTEGTYYFNDYRMVTGVYKADGSYYHFDNNGRMIDLANGWYDIDGNTYYFIYGSMQKDCWVDGRYLDENGVWNQAKGKGTWIKNNTGWWYQHSDGSYTWSNFEVINGNTYYFNEHGYMQTGWQFIDKKWYYFDGSGAMVKDTWFGEYLLDENGVWQQGVFKVKWIQDGNGWWYRHSDNGYTKNNFEVIDGKTYYFNGSGYMQTGWQFIDKKWYYFDGSGAMVKDTWFGEYLLDENGVWQQGVFKVKWIQDSTGWWYRHSDGGYTKNNFEVIDGQTYYFNGSGYMQTGWQFINSKWYYFNGSGAMLKDTWFGEYLLDENGVWQQGVFKVKWIQDGTGWWYRHSDGGYTSNNFEVIDGKTYYFNGSGYMQTGWQFINSKWYYFNGSGAMLKNTYVDGYWLDENGVWK